MRYLLLIAALATGLCGYDSMWPMAQIYRCGVLEGIIEGLSTSPVKDGLPERISKTFTYEGCAEIRKAAGR